jgi:hypothetical protein
MKKLIIILFILFSAKMCIAKEYNWTTLTPPIKPSVVIQTNDGKIKIVFNEDGTSDWMYAESEGVIWHIDRLETKKLAASLWDYYFNEGKLSKKFGK